MEKCFLPRFDTLLSLNDLGGRSNFSAVLLLFSVELDVDRKANPDRTWPVR